MSFFNKLLICFGLISFLAVIGSFSFVQFFSSGFLLDAIFNLGHLSAGIIGALTIMIFFTPIFNWILLVYIIVSFAEYESFRPLSDLSRLLFLV